MDMNMNPAGGMPAAEGSDPAMAESAPAAGFTVAIRVSADGALSVGVERESPEAAAEEYGDFKPAMDRKEALTMALELLKNGGEMAASEADAQFSEGFASRGGL